MSLATQSMLLCSALLRSAEVDHLLIGYFQLLLMSPLYSPLRAKMFQSKHELSLLFPSPSRQVTVVYPQRGSLSWPVWDEGVLKEERVNHKVIVQP